MGLSEQAVVEALIDRDSSEFAHYVADDEPRPPKVALCGAQLRGVPATDSPVCPVCESIVHKSWAGVIRSIHGPGAMN